MKYFRSKAIISVLAFIILLLGLGITVVISQHPTENRSRASESTATVVTNYSADFSGTQGQNGWWYGYSNGQYLGTNFQQMGAFNGSVWQVDGSKYWIQIARDNMHPNGTTTSWPRQPAWFDVVKRWVSTVSGPITISGNVADLDGTDSGSGEDGVYFSIWDDANKIWEGHINNGDSMGVNYNLSRTVHVGSHIDFVVSADGNDYNDTTRFDVLITQAGSTTPQGSTQLHLNLLMHGIGKAGDSINPGEPGGGNTNPTRNSRNITVTVYTLEGQQVLTKQGTVNYDSSSGSFTGNVDLGTSLGTEQYLVKVKMSQSLNTEAGTITGGTTNTLPTISLVTGDINDDDTDSTSLNVLDYNIFLGCYSTLLPAASCEGDQKVQSDLDDNKKVDDYDFNLFIRELTHLNYPDL